MADSPGDDDRPDDAAIARFLAAGVVDRDLWRDGTGYPLVELDAMSAATREQLIGRLPVRGWREVEVLASLDSPVARAAMRTGFVTAGQARQDVGLALLRWAPDCLSDAERTELVVLAIEAARGGNGLDAALEAAQAWHPDPVLQALWRALDGDDRVVVVHVAALLHYLHGLTREAFDLSRRTDFLRFAAADAAEREAARASLWSRVGGAEVDVRPEATP